jgi:PIN domain nuclease of toxin-antitoxin system
VKLLLDTHVFLWWWQGSPKLRGAGRDAIARADVALVSVVSAWEAAIKAALGRLRFAGAFGAAVDACGFRALSLEFPHVEALRALPPHHSDPFDRMLVAQAQVEGLTLVTRDATLESYPVPTLRV